MVKKRKGTSICECIMCGDLFISYSDKAKYCSSICKAEYYKSKKIREDIYKDVTNYKIFKRDNFKCIYCGRSSIEDGVKLHLDHIRPKSKNGKDLIDNIVTSCEKCNVSKGNTISEELIEKISNIVKKRNELMFNIR